MSKETPAVVTNTTSTFPVFGLLGAVLVILKVLGKITLAWKWVLAPFWVPAVIGLGVFGIIMLFAIVAGIIALIVD